MKKIFYSLLVIVLLSAFTSCTVDEIEPVKNTNPPSSSFAKDVDIVPPPPPPPTK